MKRSLFAATILLALAPLLSFSAEEKVVPKTIGKLESLDPAFDKLISPGTPIEVLAGRRKGRTVFTSGLSLANRWKNCLPRVPGRKEWSSSRTAAI